ncbi:uncharacterized protein LOC135387331 [Ornithodoros turicata]|uniref:uncharacterized protein LOC135387331 n=1 Tax=Ornithodoros turicata TaxID=34597 RepID=UPI00313A292A
MDLSPEKTVFIAVTRKKLKDFSLTVRGEAIKRTSSHRFLGIVLHRNLSWTQEIRKLQQKTKTYISIMKIMAGVRWGNTSMIMNFHQALVRQSLAHNIPHLQNITAHQERQLDAILGRSLRICLGVPKTTRTSLVLAEAREPPAVVLRSQELERHLVRLITRHSDHELIKKVASRHKSSAARTLKQLLRSLPKKRIHTTKQDRPPWLLHEPRVHMTIPCINKKADTNSSVLRTSALTHLEEKFPAKTMIYTDGSCSQGKSASAFVVEDVRKGYRLSHDTSSTMAELRGIFRALCHIRKSTPKEWIICSDSLSLHMISLGSDTYLVYKIITTVTDINQAGHSVVFQWVPSHCGIQGNEAADETAREALAKRTLSGIPFTKAGAKSYIRQRTAQRSVHQRKRNLRLSDHLSHIGTKWYHP